MAGDGNGAESKVVKLALEAGDDFRIRNRQWEDCDIIGPAICAMISNVQVDNCTFHETAEMVFWVGPEHIVIGPIGLENVQFERCRFRGVAFVGSPEMVRDWRASISG